MTYEPREPQWQDITAGGRGPISRPGRFNVTTPGPAFRGLTFEKAWSIVQVGIAGLARNVKGRRLEWREFDDGRVYVRVVKRTGKVVTGACIYPRTPADFRAGR